MEKKTAKYAQKMRVAFIDLCPRLRFTAKQIDLILYDCIFFFALRDIKPLICFQPLHKKKKEINMDMERDVELFIDLTGD